MRFEELKRVWREEGTGQYKRVRIEDLAAAQHRASNHLNHLVRHGLRLSASMLLITIPLFGWAAMHSFHPFLAWPGAVLLWGWLAVGLAFLWRLRDATPDPGLPVREAVHVELGRLRMLERFRQRVPWSLPAFIVGEISLFTGLSPDPREGLRRILFFSAVVLVMTALALRGNRWALERLVRPLRQELESWADDLEALDVDQGGGDQSEAPSGGLG